MTRPFWPHIINFSMLFGYFWLILKKQTRLKIAYGCCQQLSDVPVSIIKIGLAFAERKRPFLWNQNWFQVIYYSDSEKPEWDSQIFRHFDGIFFLWSGFKDLKIAVFWLKLTISGFQSYILAYRPLKPMCIKLNNRCNHC